MPADLPIYLQRNEDWSRSLFVADSDGNAIDLTGMTVAMAIRERLGSAVTTATCEIIDAVGGEILVTIKGSIPPLSTYGSQIQTVNLRHDIRITESDGFETVLWSGVLVLSRGETR